MISKREALKKLAAFPEVKITYMDHTTVIKGLGPGIKLEWLGVQVNDHYQYKDWKKHSPKDFDIKLAQSNKAYKVYKNIPLGDLSAILVTQTFAVKQTVQKYIKHGIPQVSSVVKCGHYYVFINGTHRLVAAILLEKTSLYAQVKILERS